MKDTEEVELTDVDLFAEYLELQMLPGIVQAAAQAVLPGVPGKAEWNQLEQKARNPPLLMPPVSNGC